MPFNLGVSIGWVLYCTGQPSLNRMMEFFITHFGHLLKCNCHLRMLNLYRKGSLGIQGSLIFFYKTLCMHDITKSYHNIQLIIYTKKVIYSTKCLLIYRKINKPLFWQQTFTKEANVLVIVAKINVFFKAVKAAKRFHTIFKMFPPFIFTERVSLILIHHPMEIF